MGYYIPVEQGVNLYVEDINPNGRKTIVFIHGWPLNHKQFEYQYNVLPAMGYRCIGIDWRGFGKSDKPISGYTYNRLADDIRMVIDALQLDDFVLVGHSTGGAIAIRYMSRYNGKGVSNLILVDAAAPTGFTAETADKLLKETYNDRPNMLQGITNEFFFQYITHSFAEWFKQLGLQAASWSTASVIILLRDENVAADLSAINTPTIIIHGVHDQVIPFTQTQELHEKIKHSQLIPFYYSGHGGFWEERDKFNHLLLEILS
ncbi:alpha/beta fold hydrolase [Gracilibacillus dipsosauri]|uniref:alpha/beta fold hydrolase n=1 Tax=Gracilibacillus dipsosauri TaxID=178340 RepID=UPI002409E11F